MQTYLRLALIPLIVQSIVVFAADPIQTNSAAQAENLPANATPMQMVKALGDENPAVRENARQRLRSLGRAAIEPLEFAALSVDPEIRMSAVEILIDLRGRGFLGVGLEEEDPLDIDDSDSNAQKSRIPYVRASQVLSYLQYVNMGVKNPFPAERAGIQAGDRILEVNGRAVYGVKDLMRIISIIGPGRTADVLMEREGKPVRIQAILTRNPMTAQMTPSKAPPVDLEKEMDVSPAAPVQGNPIRPALNIEINSEKK